MAHDYYDYLDDEYIERQAKEKVRREKAGTIILERLRDLFKDMGSTSRRMDYKRQDLEAEIYLWMQGR